MLKTVNYNALHGLGLSVWEPRALKHPSLAADNTLIIPDTIRINARCLVLLFTPQLTPAIIEVAEQKILTGMLGVLELSPDDLMVVNVYSQNPDLLLITSKLQQWAPYAVLQLTMDLPVLNVATNLVRTYGPNFLVHNPQHKAAAYKDLLTLRKILHHGTS